MKATQNLRASLAKSEALINWLDSKIDGLAVPASDRTRLAGGCIDAAMEHHKAVVLLVANRLYGSALAMVRPTFEAYLRGAWLHQCADSGNLDRFKVGKLELKMGTVIADLEATPSFECGTLLKAKKAGWTKMCDFTHTGVQQAIRRNKQESIEPDYDDSELIEALGFADAIGAMCAIEIAHLGQHLHLAQDVFERIKVEFPRSTGAE